MKILNKEDIMEIYLLMDKLNEIFHDPTRSEDINVIKNLGIHIILLSISCTTKLFGMH